jgi:hypothetical protein
MNSQKIVYSLNNDLLIHIEKVSQSISVLSFTDINYNKINIPNGTFMYSYEDKHKYMVNPIPYTQCYSLCYTDKYELLINGVKIHITNKRDFSIE